MTDTFTVCEVSPSLQKILKEFRFRKSGNNIDALIMKVDKESREIVLEEEMEDTTIEGLLEELPTHQPRFLLMSYKLCHPPPSPRTSFPLCFFFISPRDCQPEMQVMYAGSKLELQKHVDTNKTFEIRELEEFSEEWLVERLMRF